MTQPIEEITGSSGGNNVKQTLEKWGYTPGKGFASTSSQSNTGNNTTRENSNDKLNNAAMDTKDAGSVGGGMNANTIAQTQSSNTGNSSDNSSGGMKHRSSDNAKFHCLKNSKSDFDPAIPLFGDTDPKLKTLQNAYKRLGVNITSETMSKIDADVINKKSLEAPNHLNTTTLKQALDHAPSHIEAYSDSSDFN